MIRVSSLFKYYYLPVLLLALVTPSFVFSEASQKKDHKSPSEQPIVVKAESLEIDNKRKIITFSGNVDAKEADFQIKCKKMLIYYLDKPTGSLSSDQDFKIDKIIAQGNVKIIRPDGFLATAEHAIYYQIDEKVVLTGNPVVRQGEDLVEGAKITLFLKEDRSLVEGSADMKVKAILFPKSEKR